MRPSSTRVAERHLKEAAQVWPVPLSKDQRRFLKDLSASLNRELQKTLEGAAPHFSARTDYQTEKVYKRDGFGRNSVLAGNPHARISIGIDVRKGETVWRSAVLPSLDFLLSEDGETAVVKADSHWGRGLSVRDARHLGKEWAAAILRRVNKDLQVAELQAEKHRRMEEEQQRQEEEARLKKQRELELQGGGQGYTFQKDTQWENDDLDVDDDPWDGPGDPESGYDTDTTKRKSLLDVASLVSRGGQATLYRDKVVLTTDYDRTYNNKRRGLYSLTRNYMVTATIQRADKKPFSDTEQAYIEKMILSQADRVRRK